MAVEFEIEQSFTIAGRGGFVAARRLSGDTVFVMSPSPSLSGIPIERWFDTPRSMGSDGLPRTDLFIFKLAQPENGEPFVLAIVVSLGLASSSAAGVTIHFEGKARNRAAINRALDAARTEARRLNWVVTDASVASSSMTRIVDEAERPYTGPLTGIVIRPHALCEPLYIQFGADLFLQDFVKTQFAGAEQDGDREGALDSAAAALAYDEALRKKQADRRSGCE